MRMPIIAWRIDENGATPITPGFPTMSGQGDFLIATPDGLFLGFGRIFFREADVVAEIHRYHAAENAAASSAQTGGMRAN